MVNHKHPFFYALLAVILAFIGVFEPFVIKYLISLGLRPIMALLLALLFMAPFTFLFAHIIQPQIIKILGFPRTDLLLSSKNFKGTEYYIFSNLIYLYSKCRNSRYKAITAIRKGLFEFIISLDVSRIQNNAVFYLETWLITQRDLQRLHQLGFDIQRNLKKKTTFTFKIVHYILNKYWPSHDFEWYWITFDMETVNCMKKNFSAFNDVKHFYANKKYRKERK